MIKKLSQMETKVNEHMRGGAGSVQVLELMGKNDVKHCRMFSKLTIKPGCSIGKHEHVNETEYYWILEGEGTVTESDGDKLVKAGDLVITGGGASHAIRNDGDKDLVFLALIILD